MTRYPVAAAAAEVLMNSSARVGSRPREIPHSEAMPKALT
jgi:hypothetical protein